MADPEKVCVWKGGGAKCGESRKALRWKGLCDLGTQSAQVVAREGVMTFKKTLRKVLTFKKILIGAQKPCLLRCDMR